MKVGVIKTIMLLPVLFIPLRAAAADVPGSKDHPMISRYPSSEIIVYESRDFDQYRLHLGSVQNARTDTPKSMSLEGKVTRLGYRTPKNRSALEVFRNYEQSIREASFSVLFQCDDQSCGRALGEVVTPTDQRFHYNYKGQKYLAAKLQRAEGDVYLSLFTVLSQSSGGDLKDRVLTQLDVIEIKPMQKGLVKVTVDAGTMAREIQKGGRIALYGIYFDSGKATVKPESREALAEIAKLLKTQDRLKLLVVGHTDTDGTFDYNIDLSKRRAEAVVQALVAEYGIARDRLKPWGVGYSAPVASNGAETGRAKNRRVELVQN